ncbi:uncharacterized protein [Diadema antillarum]|uniref:uncharacterized protein n=1 Tax=Diadema antillarum TaxID=105358 RepID=UPI003A8A2323
MMEARMPRAQKNQNEKNADKRAKESEKEIQNDASASNPTPRSQDTGGEVTGDFGGQNPSYTLSLGQGEGEGAGTTLLVYEDRTSSSSEVKMKVISMTPEDAPAPQQMEEAKDDFLLNNSGDPARNEEEDQAAPVEIAPQKSGPVTWSCEDCDFTTTKRHAFLSHRVTHTRPDKEQLYHCVECSYTTPHRYNLKTHLKRHMDFSDLEDSEIFKCDKCDYTTMYKHDLMTHSKKHDPEKQFRCLHCDFTSIYRQSLVQHNLSRHQGLRPHACPHCPYSAARKQDLDTHMWRHSKQKRFKCPECDYETQYKLSFQSHVDKHKGVRAYQCDMKGCHFSTTTKANLKAHMERHSKKFRCDKCGIEATTAKKLEKHRCGEKQSIPVTPIPVKSNDGSDGVTFEYKCPSCDFRTKSKHSLKRHSERHEPNRLMPEKAFTCEYCGYATAYKTSLKRHMARHSLVKPFKCGHCDYTAINMSQMRVHIAKHTGIKPHQCHVCSYATANKQHLITHMSKHSHLRLQCIKCGFMTAWKDRMRIHLKAHQEGRIFNTSSQPIHTSYTVRVKPPSDSDDTMTVPPASDDVPEPDAGSYLVIDGIEVLGADQESQDSVEESSGDGDVASNDAVMVVADNIVDETMQLNVGQVKGGKEEGNVIIVSEEIGRQIQLMQHEVSQRSELHPGSTAEADPVYSMVTGENEETDSSSGHMAIPGEALMKSGYIVYSLDEHLSPYTWKLGLCLKATNFWTPTKPAFQRSLSVKQAPSTALGSSLTPLPPPSLHHESLLRLPAARK